jgi:hypothetical protein
VNPAVIRKAAGTRQGKSEGGPVIPDAGIEYSIRSIRNSRRNAVVIRGPGPNDVVADLGGKRARIEVGSALSDGHVSRGGGSEGRKDGNKKGELTEMH